MAGLETAVLFDCLGPIDLAPLAAMEQSDITVHPGTVVQGAERIPPERLAFVKY